MTDLPPPGEERGFGAAEEDDRGDGMIAADGDTPPHLAGQDVQRAAVLLPFTHPNRRVRADAEAIFAAVELALFDQGADTFVLMPKDTAGTQSGAQQAAEGAVKAGADVIIGPLFSANVTAVSDVVNQAYEDALREQRRDRRFDSRRKREAKPADDRNDALPDFLRPVEEVETRELRPAPDGARLIPIIAFSNDRTASEGGAYLASITPEEEVARIVEYSVRQGIQSFAFLGPSSSYGRRVEAALRLEASRNGAFVIASGLYDPSNDAPIDEAQIVANAVQTVAETRPDTVAVLVPERGVKLRAVAPLLPYYGVDTRTIRMLGTGAWNDPSLWREPTLIGGLFAAPNPADLETFTGSYERVYGGPPSTLAALGYDAAALAMGLAAQDRLTREDIADRDGFYGVNGLFRFKPDGSAERGLAVLEIQAGEGAVAIERGPRSFDGFEG